MDDKPVVVLPRRQYEVGQLASRGLSNKEIANALDISVHTVRNTMRVVFEKLQVENRVGVANAFAGNRVQQGTRDHAASDGPGQVPSLAFRQSE